MPLYRKRRRYRPHLLVQNINEGDISPEISAAVRARSARFYRRQAIWFAVKGWSLAVLCALALWWLVGRYLFEIAELLILRLLT